MTDANQSPSTPLAARLLKGAAAVFAGLGGGFLFWVGSKWMEYPQMRASQFGFEAPYWPALGGFVLVSILAVVGLFWTAARRVEEGEELFSNRHRKQRSEWSSNTNGEHSA